MTTAQEPASTATYTWDARNRLTTITAPGFAAAFAYDALGRRTVKTVQGVTTNYLYDGLNPVQEKAGASVTANILPGLGIDEYFTRTDSTGTRTVLPDALGSTLALTDATGTLTTQYTYEPFGNTTVAGAATTSAFQYTGRENDGTGLYYYRARYYSPRLQRFISEDPIGFAGGDINLYGYVGNNPIGARDPLGLWYPWFHKWMTRKAASECGMSDNDADALARADVDMDFSFGSMPSLSTLLPFNKKHGMPRPGWMPGQDWQDFVSTKLYSAADTGSLQDLGQGLHSLQDAYSHDLAGAGCGIISPIMSLAPARTQMIRQL